MSDSNPTSSAFDSQSRIREAEEYLFANCLTLEKVHEFSEVVIPKWFFVRSLGFDHAVKWCDDHAATIYKTFGSSRFKFAIEANYHDQMWLFPGKTLISSVNKHIRNLSWLDNPIEKTDIDREDLTYKESFYQIYMASPEWAARREEALCLAEYRCLVCNSSESLDVHHRTYKNFGNEPQIDLTVLCRECHTIFHRYGRLARR